MDKWVTQGGFAGDNVVPSEYRLEKFEGMISCPTFNFNGASNVALSLLASENIKEKYLVSKNVCHGVIYDYAMHEKFTPFKDDSAGINLAYRGMELFLKKKSKGKKFHDPLALSVAFDKSVCEFREVEMFRKRGGWGANLATNTNTFISIAADEEKIIKVLTQQK
ncbi:MAG: hypothetical protein GY827_05185 [Cytophagales bacterium]|nr:hypothetical protein [Cytophagales bacterium]